MSSARVLRGAVILDNYFGKQDWRSEINLDKLVMEDPFRCVLGQLFGDYTTALHKLGLAFVPDGTSPRWEAGFSTDAWDNEDWERLDYEWKTYLADTAGKP